MMTTPHRTAGGGLRPGARRIALALALLTGAVGACFTGEALRGEPCQEDDACGPRLACLDGICGGEPETFTCGDGVRVSIANIKPNVVFILDRSGSMSEPLAPGESLSRWGALRGLVTAAASQLEGEVNFGIVHFPAADASPNQVDRACNSNLNPSVPVEAGNAGAILEAIPELGEVAGEGVFVPAGAAPMASAVRIAREHLVEDLDRQLTKAQVIISDSAANCGESAVTITEKLETLDTDLQAEILAAAAEGIPTYVVGLAIVDELTPDDSLDPDGAGDGQPDATNLFELFNELAILGDTARPGPVRFYESGDQAALLAELAALPDATLDCTLPLEPAPDYPELIEVEVDGKVYERRQAAECVGDGYRFSADSLDEITLCGSACARFQTSGELRISYRCPGSKSSASGS